LNDPGAPPDWGSIFHRARRRIVGRLLVVAILAASGTALLLGGGLSAQGAVSLRIIGSESDAKTNTTQGKAAKKSQQRKGVTRDAGKSANDGSEVNDPSKKPSKPSKPDKPKKHPDQWKPCSGTAAGVQYCDSPEEVDGRESTLPSEATVQP
jgi:hypothetical protein